MIGNFMTPEAFFRNSEEARVPVGNSMLPVTEMRVFFSTRGNAGVVMKSTPVAAVFIEYKFCSGVRCDLEWRFGEFGAGFCS
jgi:hypothetical protein